MKKIQNLGLLLLFLGVLSSLGSGCVSAYRKSVGAQERKVFIRVYRADFDTAWMAVLDSLKSSRFDISNRDTGLIVTRWSDNTAQKNMMDGMRSASVLPYIKAQYRFRIQVANGVYDGYRAVRLSVLKDQVVRRDVLDDFHPEETDQIEEKTLLYRIGRLVLLKAEAARLDEIRIQDEIARTREEEAIRREQELQNSKAIQEGLDAKGFIPDQSDLPDLQSIPIKRRPGQPQEPEL